jgi:hypothetical protein
MTNLVAARDLAVRGCAGRPVGVLHFNRDCLRFGATILGTSELKTKYQYENSNSNNNNNINGGVTSFVVTASMKYRGKDIQ